MISVPGGKARVATRTFGPVGTGASVAAAASGVEASVNMLRAMKAVMTAIKSAVTSNATFLLSMTNCPLSGALIERLYFIQNG